MGSGRRQLARLRSAQGFATAAERARRRHDARGGSLAVDGPGECRPRVVPPVHVTHDGLVAVQLSTLQRYSQGLGEPGLEQRLVVVAPKVLLHPSEEVQLRRPHSSIGIRVSRPRRHRIEVGVEGVEQTLEVVLFASVWRGCQQEQVVGHRRYLLRGAEVLARRGQAMCFVEDCQRPRRARSCDLAQDVGVVGQQVDGDDPHIDVVAQWARAAGRRRVDPLSIDTEVAPQVGEPLGDEVSWRDHEHLAGHDQTATTLGHIHPGHDRFARPGLVG